MAELVVALDFGDRNKALDLAEKINGLVPWCKVGLELFLRFGPAGVSRLKEMGFKVFLDLKFHDIPNTVSGAVRSAAACGADMLTIHLMGGSDMVRAAVEARNSLDSQFPLILGVTILTSTRETQMSAGGQTGDIVASMARQGRDFGVDGVVCSAREAAKVKSVCGRKYLVLTPGIRRPGDAAEDQARTMEPAEAVRQGADFLVVGRPIIRDPHPRQAAEMFLMDMHAEKVISG